MNEPTQMIDEEKDYFFEFHEEWSQVLGHCNWYTITPIKIEVEWDKVLGGLEATFIILGLGVRWRWTYTETETAQNIRAQVEEIEAELDMKEDHGT